MRRIGVLLGLCLGTMVVLQGQAAPLALVSTAWPPFTNAPGQPRFALDLVEEACRRIGIGVTTAIVPAEEFTNALLNGPYDGSAAAWKDAARERELYYSQPYLENRLVLIGRHGADVSATSLEPLAGRRIAIVAGYSYGDAVDRGGPAFIRSASEEDSLARLLRGDVEYVLIDALVVEYIAAHYPEQASTRLAIGDTALVTRPLHLAVRRSRLDAATLVSRFNEQLRGMIADRTYHRLLHVDWIRADVNGDGVPEYVPATDQPGPAQPLRIYSLFSNPAAPPVPSRPSEPGFYLGGTIYSDWARVPERYKEVAPRDPDPAQHTASLFSFVW